jgi:hypothetical protein
MFLYLSLIHQNISKIIYQSLQFNRPRLVYEQCSFIHVNQWQCWEYNLVPKSNSCKFLSFVQIWIRIIFKWKRVVFKITNKAYTNVFLSSKHFKLHPFWRLVQFRQSLTNSLVSLSLIYNCTWISCIQNICLVSSKFDIKLGNLCFNLF